MTKFTNEKLISRAKARLEHMQEAMRDHSGSPDACMDLRLAELAYAAVTAPQLPQPAVMDENGLLPCPFCGSPAEHYPDGDMEGYSVMCGHKNGDCDSWIFGFATPEEAERSWNTRAAMLQGDRRDLTHPVDPQIAAYEKIMEQAVPDGWVAVLVEPTEDMVIAGFEAELREEFRDPEAWEAFEAMSGCEQAATRAKWCWAAMIAARPKLKHDLT
ncbi:hypothetical protein M2354_001199 [Leclercia adecarboxylata]|uniref:Lar family restriction alleviation protein n=1 Tax=Leclercia adecarboxylata TaxID=83655 RepID=UPI0024748972|nr:hypothetical protein [Leclercia adecarboxylata]MDH6161544.1 hypothetical protein [Leclercia adecarboxylata]